MAAFFSFVCATVALFAVAVPQTEIPSATEVAVDVTLEAAHDDSAVYVGLVTEDQPFRNPLREEILQGRSATTFAAPPGRYRIVCGATGFETVFSPPFEIPPSGKARKSISLRRLLPLKGRVVDNLGNPLADAAVGLWDAFLRDAANRLSPLGEEHLRRNATTRTGDAGWFELPALPGFRHRVWVEAAGFAPGWLRDVLFKPPEENGPWEIRLARGGSLAVSWQAEAQATGARFMLLRAKASPLGKPYLAESLGLWERPVEGAEGTAQWPALPAGDYELWLRAPRRGIHQDGPALVASVSLETRTAKQVKIELSQPVGLDAEAEAAPDLRLLLPKVDRKKQDELEVTLWSANRAQSQKVSLSSASGGVLLDLPGGCRRGVRLLVVAGQQVGSLVQDQDPPCRETRRVGLFPSATIDATLLVPAGERLPQVGLLRAFRCPEGRLSTGEELGAFPFRIESGGRIHARLPAGCVAAVLEVGDFAPLAIGQAKRVPAATSDLGTVRLAFGGALLARTLDGATLRPLSGVAVEAVPLTKRDSPLKKRAGSTDETGWVRLFGLEPGDYRLRLLPPGRHWPHIAGPFEVRARDEGLFDEILIPPPGSLEVELRPSEGLAELAASFRVSLAARDPHFRDELAPTPGDENRFLFPEVPPGIWDFTALALLRTGGVAPVRRTEVEVQPGELAQVAIDLEGDLYRGKVTYLGQPVEGSLSLRPTRLEQRYSVTVSLSPEGTFTALLDRPGLYQGQVTDRKARFSRATLPNVRFDRPEREVHLVVSTGRLMGRVVDASGQPVADAEVEAMAQRGAQEAGVPADLELVVLRAASAADGTFMLSGVGEGPWTLMAEERERRSQPHGVRLGPDESVDVGDLTLLEKQVVEGQVQDELGRAVAGVVGSVIFSSKAPGELPRSIRWTSDRDGRFSFDAAGSMGTLGNFILRAPAMASTASRQTVADGLILRMPTQGGSAELRLEGSSWQSAPVRGLYLVRDDGAFLAPRLEGHGADTQRVEPLAPGRWRLVLLDSGSLLPILAQGGGTQLPPLAELVIEPGKHVVATVHFRKGGDK